MSLSRSKALVVFLHGSGDTGRGVREWARSVLGRKFLDPYPHIDVVYPTARAKPYTLNGGMKSNVWFDRTELSLEAPDHEDTLMEALKRVDSVIQESTQENPIPLSRIIVGGFSMGGALSLQWGLRRSGEDDTPAGIFALSSFLSSQSSVFPLPCPTSELAPIFYTHGEADLLVPASWGANTAARLQAQGVRVSFSTYPDVEHELARDPLLKLEKWIVDRLPA
eukprot:Colp12_sorted_trinity150504_noHs@19246